MVTNILVFLVTFIISIAIYYYSVIIWRWAGIIKSKRKVIIHISLIALACIPFDINGSKFSLLGGGTSEKSFYSVFSIWQEAKENTLSAVSVGYHKSKDNSSFICVLSKTKVSGGAFSVIKVLCLTEAEGNIFPIIDVLCDNESKGEIKSLISVLAISNSSSGNSSVLLPILNFQHGGNKTFSGIGFSLAIDSPDHERLFAPSFLQMGDKNGKRFFVLY